jgi:hypothetical protein
LILIDDDVIETSNLNRTPFRICDIGQQKCDALKYLIHERRPVDILTINERTSDSVYDTLLEELDDSYGISTIIDCRDNVCADLYGLDIDYYYKLGYDGLDMTIDGDPENTPVWGESTGYSVTPSFICPSQMIANICVTDLLVNKEDNDDEDSYKTIGGRLYDVMSFSSTDILSHVFKGIKDVN